MTLSRGLRSRMSSVSIPERNWLYLVTYVLIFLTLTSPIEAK